MKQALYYEKNEDQSVTCLLCPNKCLIKPEMKGICKARRNVAGDLYSLNYAKVTSVALDPIEKKPLNMFHPGSFILSAGTFGCNLKCPFCQNWSISQQDGEEAGARELKPEELVKMAVRSRDEGNIGVAFTYNEPTVWFEFVLETAKLVRMAGMKNVLVTNGYISQEPLKQLLPFIDAMNIDVKGFTESYYRDVCHGSLEDVKRTVEVAAGSCHVEITTLLIPGLNDEESEIERLSGWISSISPFIPLHLSRYFPNYKMKDRPPTPRDTLLHARETAMKHLAKVFLGNI
ncbi:MAG: AmmeMemoRadiSam system radical SAM enzyme [Clostridiales bacterium]|nr:AmmeMemoRadiSam system radical SAM enzyme [Clostridiales bacterium]